MDYNNDTERREFFRLSYKAPVQFKFYEAQSSNRAAQLVEEPLDGNAKNISQKGVLFQTVEHPPQLSSIVWMSMDMRTLKICQEIESKALILNHGVLGKVVRVEEDIDKDNTYDIGVCFLRNDQRQSPDVRAVLNRLQ